MRLTCKFRFLLLFLVVILFLQNASAALVWLPESTYAEAVGNWEGTSVYSEDGLFVRVDFTVYDTDFLTPGEEKDFVDTVVGDLGLEGKYIYAYQLFNARGEYPDVGEFQVLNLDGTEISQVLADIGSHDDEQGGVEPTGVLTNGTWLFAGGVLTAGEHSWFLIYSSDFGPTLGSYGIRGAGEVPAPIPEPAVIALLGLGSVPVLMKRRMSV